MRVVVPYDAVEPKTRLGSILDATERTTLAETMLRDVLAALREAGRQPAVLANAPLDDSLVEPRESGGSDLHVVVDDRPLTTAVNAVLTASDGPVAVVMADLALATPAALDRLFEADGDVVLAPGRGGGTNAIVARHPDFRVDYHGASYRDHLATAREVGASVETVDSFRLSTDVDEPADLPELLLHGEGRTAAWLRDIGVRLAVGETGRVGVQRPE